MEAIRPSPSVGVRSECALAFGQLEFQFGELFANVLRQPRHVHVEFGHGDGGGWTMVTVSAAVTVVVVVFAPAAALNYVAYHE